MNSSLNKLAKNLSKSYFKYLSQGFSGHLLKLVKQKGVNPCEYTDSFEKLSEDKLPDRCEFFSSVKDKHVSEKRLIFVISSSGLSWNAILKMTKIELKLISNTEVYYFIEKGMKGGVSYINERYNKANCKYMIDYGSSKKSKFIVYLDANNLYGWAMGHNLPYDGFKWLSQKEIDRFDGNSISEDSCDGYLSEVGLEYPAELHYLHNDYPLAPEKLEIIYDMLPDSCRKIADKYGIKVSGVQKLVANLHSKSKYVVHYRNVQLYLTLEMILTKVHRVLKIKQSEWLSNTLILIQTKEKIQQIALKKIFFN